MFERILDDTKMTENVKPKSSKNRAIDGDKSSTSETAYYPNYQY